MREVGHRITADLRREYEKKNATAEMGKSLRTPAFVLMVAATCRKKNRLAYTMLVRRVEEGGEAERMLAAYRVGRSELLAWLNELLQISYTKVCSCPMPDMLLSAGGAMRQRSGLLSDHGRDLSCEIPTSSGRECV
eukprot:768754-Hanusia_phi.AAC.7